MDTIGSSCKTSRSAIFIEGGTDVSAVRTATRKYAHHRDGFEELYDIAVDPYELDNKVHDPRYAGDARPTQALYGAWLLDPMSHPRHVRWHATHNRPTQATALKAPSCGC